jgi:HTH DNA binding domain
MRRLVVEFYGRELERRMERSSFKNAKSMEVVHLLKNDQNEFAAICRIRLKDRSLKVEDCFKDDGVTTDVQVLEREGEVGGEEPAFLILLKRKSRSETFFGQASKPGSGYMFGPPEFNEGRLRFTFLGTQRQVGEFLGAAEQKGLQCKVISLTDADFGPDSLLNRLTEKQRKVLVSAYRLGYYDVPRRISSAELAESLSLRGATVVEHLRKAERRLLAGILNES